MSEYSNLKSSVAVIGAGIQGVCISLFLIKKGFKVTLIDRDEPGKESASYGNAGHFSPYAVVQLRKENLHESMWNIVGFQTKMKIKDQKEVLSIIPALKNAEFLRFGSIHRNTYINSPGVISQTLQSKKNPLIIFAGQITGVEGYCESSAMGLIAGINSSRIFKKQEPFIFPPESALGCLTKYISDSTNKKIQPMNINLGLFDIEKPKKNIDKIKKSSIQSIIEINRLNQIELDVV